MRILAVAILLLLAAARSDAQVNVERTTRIGTLEFTSSVGLVDDDRMLRTVVRVTNRGRDSTELETPTPSCTVMLLIHRDIMHVRAPIYDGWQRERVCTAELRMWKLAPDSSLTFTNADSVAVVRQRTSPGVLYYFSARIYVGRLGSVELLTGAGRIP
jgi:hypothetical protein